MENLTLLHSLLRNFLFVIIGLTVTFNPLKAQWEPVNYDMDIRVDFASEKIYVDCELTVKNNSSEAVSELPVSLYRLLTVDSVKDSLDNDLHFEQKITVMEGIPKLQVNSVNIKLLEKVELGERYKVNISYEGYILGNTDGIGAAYRERIEEPFTILRYETFAYPHPGPPTLENLFSVMFFSYDYNVKVTVPKHLVVANGGELLKTTHMDGQVSYKYRNIKPAWRMDFAIASYEILEEDGFKIFYFPEIEEGADRVMGLVKKTMELYYQWFGPLKDFISFSIIQIPEGYGAQTDVTSVLQSGEVFTSDDYNVQIYHELSHLWHPMETEPFPPCRWNEGLATFLQNLVAEKLDNKPGFLNRMSNYMKQKFVSQCKNRPDCMETPLIDYGQTLMFDFSYNKGMILFHVLYELIGHDAFMNLIGSYYNKYYQTGGSTHELTAMIKELPYEGLSRFVDEWFYGVESNEYLFQGMSVEEIVAIYKR